MSFRAHISQRKENEKYYVTNTSRKNFDLPNTPENKIKANNTNQKKAFANSTNNSIEKAFGSHDNFFPLNMKRLSMNNREEQQILIKKTPLIKKNDRNKKYESENLLETRTLVNRTNDAKNLIISNFDETLKENVKTVTTPHILKENIEKPVFSNKRIKEFSPKMINRIEENLNKTMKFQSNHENKRNEVLKSVEWDFKTKKKEFFLNNINNLMSNKMLHKCISKIDEEGYNNDKKNVKEADTQQKGKEKDDQEKRQTKLYQYILDH